MRNSPRHRGAVLPLFAVLLPVLLMLCVFAINVAYMQLTRTELRVATDSAARAGGRAWSKYQDIGQARVYARNAARENRVAGQPLRLRVGTRHQEVEFGTSERANNGYGRYVFTPQSISAVANGSVDASAIRITGKRTAGSRSGTISLLFGGVGATSLFEPVATAVCTQVDRDIALVLDKSGSMAYYKDEEALTDELERLYNSGAISYWDHRYTNSTSTSATGLYTRFYSEDVRNALPADMAIYAAEMTDYCGWYESGGYWWQGSVAQTPAPQNSRWDLLTDAVGAFLDVLEDTDQEELVSLATFDSSGHLDHYLETDFNQIRDSVATIIPYNGTSIGEGMQQGINTLLTQGARPYAAKTIVVMTDGVNNYGEISPVTVANTIVTANNVTIHSVTFTDGADQDTMREVATIGGGSHYHDDDGSSLVDIFEEIANNLPSIITD